MSLYERYLLYVEAMQDLGLPWITFDEWLNK